MKNYEMLKKHVAVWMNFKNIMLSESNLALKATYFMIPFI
jgi:hypothetical protein